MPLMFLNGTAMRGEKDHHVVAGATFVGAVATKPKYKFIAVRDEFPGLLAVPDGGVSVRGELYDMEPTLLYDGLLPQEPPELELATVELERAQVPGADLIGAGVVHSMQLRPQRLSPIDRTVDISAIGSWRAYQQFLVDNRIQPVHMKWL